MSDSTADGARPLGEAWYAVETGAQRFRPEATEGFWPRLMAGEVAGEALVTFLHMTGDFPHWEMHPEGDELFVMHDGEIEVVLDRGGEVSRFRLGARQSCVIPKGVWHFARTIAPGDLTVITFGAGTQHRPLADGPPVADRAAL